MVSGFNQYTGVMDMSGKRFGRLQPLNRDLSKKRVYWFCSCSCGQKKSIRQDALTSGRAKSCGCWNSEQWKKRVRVMNQTHGLSRHKLYRSWSSIIGRCLNPKASVFHHYGGRGILVCKRWLKFENFLSDMGDSYFHGGTIERINNNANYEPGNCKWINKGRQTWNTRQNVWLNYRGEKVSLPVLANRFGISRKILYRRIYRGWSVERALGK